MDHAIATPNLGIFFSQIYGQTKIPQNGFGDRARITLLTSQSFHI